MLLKTKTMSGIPIGFEKPVKNKKQPVSLVSTVQLLLDILTPALCQEVYKKHRIGERERKWTFHKVCLFWIAMIIRHPATI